LVPYITILSEFLFLNFLTETSQNRIFTKKETQTEKNNISLNSLYISPSLSFLKSVQSLGAKECAIAFPHSKSFMKMPYFSSLFAQKIKAMQKNGIRVFAGLAENKKDISLFSRMGICEIWTDNVPNTNFGGIIFRVSPQGTVKKGTV
jgi:hypothetical protein